MGVGFELDEDDTSIEEDEEDGGVYVGGKRISDILSNIELGRGYDRACIVLGVDSSA